MLSSESMLHTLGNKAEAKPTDNEAVPRYEDASSRGLELDVAATTQTGDSSDAEDEDTAADENVANDVRSPTEGENASDMAHEENTERKMIAHDAVAQPTNDETVSRAAHANCSDDEPDVGETAQSEAQSDTEHAAEEENVGNDMHHSTDDQNSSNVMPEAIDDYIFTDIEHHEEVEVGNASYGDDVSLDDDVKKGTVQSSDEDELGFELVDISEIQQS
ncbi:hypothetical protein AAVH_25408 [Aphelenchoides avenae]|nr:hypothetical protein AAVH_25408 [Aphelenchus avenae]